MRLHSFLIKNSRIYENMSWNRLGPIVQRLVCCGKTWRFLRVLTLFTLFALSRFQPDVEWCSSSTKWPWHFEGGLSKPGGGGRGVLCPPPQFLIDQLILYQLQGQIIPTTLVRAPRIFRPSYSPALKEEGYFRRFKSISVRLNLISTSFLLL